MIEEITTGLTNISDIEIAMHSQMAQSVANHDQILNQSMQIVAQILNITQTGVSALERIFLIIFCGMICRRIYQDEGVCSERKYH